MLAEEFDVEVEEGPWPVSLWASVLKAANDPERDTLPGWMREGFPLGISKEIEYTGVFPRTHEDTASVEASRLEGSVLEDHWGDMENYVSFQQEAERAQDLLDQMVEELRLGSRGEKL